jgi:outer membrane protein, heavy metal efflux system
VLKFAQAIAFVSLIVSFFFSKNVFASDCSLIRNSWQLYECALESYPDYRAALLTKEAGSSVREKANQLPNPELSIKSVSGKNSGELVGGTEIGISMSLTELLVKRSALMKSGRAEEKLMVIEGQEQEFKAKTTIILALYRYRQLLVEVEFIEEAISAFSKIEKQFRSRRALGPEQEITLNLVELAQGDYQLKKNHLAVEKNEIETKFKGLFGLKFELKNEVLPLPKQNWPDISLAAISQNTLELRKLEAERDKLESEKSIANAESWPKIAAGPVVERSTEGSNQYTSYGFNLTVDIPILSWNGGARDLAGKNLFKAQIQYDYALKKAELEKQLLVLKYKSAVDSLKKSTNGDGIKRKHVQVDSFFKQGMTSSSIVIEAHRQLTEFTESQHEHERVALESLMYLNLLSGKDPSEVLK